MSASKIKCVVWDLDNTVWNGVLLEDKSVSLRPMVVDLIKSFDERGILQSIASKNDYGAAMEKLQLVGLGDFFLYPQINWGAKSYSITRIQEKLNIGLDTLAFIDDSQFELDEVASVHPEIACIRSDYVDTLLQDERFQPLFITQDSKNRRKMYQADALRNQVEGDFLGPKEEFLASLGLSFEVHEATENDLKRAVELTERTNQLNSTGRIYSYQELARCISSNHYKLYVCELTDCYGSYGKIGLALVEITEEYHQLDLLLMSCRVMSRGVGTVMLSFIMQQAKLSGKGLRSIFRKTGKNDLMYVTFRFANFKEQERLDDGDVVLVNDLSTIQTYPDYIKFVDNTKECSLVAQ